MRQRGERVGVEDAHHRQGRRRARRGRGRARAAVGATRCGRPNEEGGDGGGYARHRRRGGDEETRTTGRRGVGAETRMTGRRRGGGAAASGEERGRGSRARAREREGIGLGRGGNMDGGGTIIMAHHPRCAISTSILMAHLTLVRHKYIHTNGAPHPGAPLVFFF